MNLTPDDILTAKARKNKHWWLLHLKIDFSIEIQHNCIHNLLMPIKNNECIKCKTKCDLISGPKGELQVDYLSTPSFNHNTLFTHSLQRVPEKSLTKDPLIKEIAIAEVNGINFEYKSYNIGFSMISHRMVTNIMSHPIILFRNEGEYNLVETIKKKCYTCRKECIGPSIRNFLVLQSKLQ